MPGHVHAPSTPLAIAPRAKMASLAGTIVLAMTLQAGCLAPDSGGLTGTIDDVTSDIAGLDTGGVGDVADQDAANDTAEYDVETQGNDIAGDNLGEAFVDTPICEPSCVGKVCGDDGCGGTCGDCAGAAACEAGVCVAITCPQPLIKVEEGNLVMPQSLLHLSAVNLDGTPASHASYNWSAQQPDGATSLFIPSASHPTPTFAANVTGTYIFTLALPGPNDSTLECPTYSYIVHVVPTEAIHVELVWTTPNDIDEADTGPGVGSDLDLHFTHQYAQGLDIDGDGAGDGWFDQFYDCYYYNKDANWGDFNPVVNDDARLDRDDTDGAGPENLNLGIPEDGVTYSVGVHYNSDYGFGAAFASVRIYIFGQLEAQFTAVELVQGDFWEVATITWSLPAVDTVSAIPGPDGGPSIVHDVPNPAWSR